tara:strand:+ start:1192 stop:1386 length:195 start_codon:yes stop_codon:yes gene_type:complete
MTPRVSVESKEGRDLLRKEVEEQTAIFLAKGGAVKEIPSDYCAEEFLPLKSTTGFDKKPQGTVP